jgi:hypothetical protein
VQYFFSTFIDVCHVFFVSCPLPNNFGALPRKTEVFSFMSIRDSSDNNTIIGTGWLKHLTRVLT